VEHLLGGRAWRYEMGPLSACEVDGFDLDVALQTGQLAIEVKSGRRVHDGDLRGLLALAESHKVRQSIVVCGERQPRVVDGVEIVPWRTFVDWLWDGDLL